MRAPVQAERGLALGLLDVLRNLSRHQALDRLIRGRAWIALIAFALIGIVTLQLLVLTLNASIGRALAHEAQLERENAALSIESSELAGGERIESQAARLGMELVPGGALRFLRVDPSSDIARAGAALNAPTHSSSAGSGETGIGAQPLSTSATPAGAASAEQAGASSASAQESSEASAGSGEAGSRTGEQSPPAAAPADSGVSSPTPSPAPAPAASAGAGVGEAAPSGGAPPATGAPAAGGTQSNGAG